MVSEVFMGLAPMAVAPDNQRNGVGSALVKKGLGILREQKVAQRCIRVGASRVLP